MFKSLKDLHEIKNITRALSLRQQLHHIKMAKGESVISYFKKIVELKDQLYLIGDKVEDRHLVMLAMNGLPDRKSVV